jgi:hypothetical protein
VEAVDLEGHLVEARGLYRARPSPWRSRATRRRWPS